MMDQTCRVGIIGDYDASSRFHAATMTSLHHAATARAVTVDVAWLPTATLAGEQAEQLLDPFDALWCAPGSPYRSMEGALNAIRFGRERGRPFLGT